LYDDPREGAEVNASQANTANEVQQGAEKPQLLPDVQELVSIDISNKSEEELYQIVDRIRDKIVQVKEQRTRLIEEVKSLREKRRSLIDKKREIVGQLLKLREERKGVLDELAKVKEELNNALNELKSKREQLREARQLLEKEGNIAKLSLRKVLKRIEELEWKQQTSVLPPQEEKRLVEEIERLEAAGREDQEGQTGGDIDNGARGRGEGPKAEAQRSHQ